MVAALVEGLKWKWSGLFSYFFLFWRKYYGTSKVAGEGAVVVVGEGMVVEILELTLNGELMPLEIRLSLLSSHNFFLLASFSF